MDVNLPDEPNLPALDADGEDVATPDLRSDVAHLIYLLEWGRKRGFRIGPTVKLGGLVLSVVDLRQSEGGQSLTDEGPWAAAGYKGGDE